MDYARDHYSREIVAAKDASPLCFYECPRPGCGGRVYLPDVVIQRPHFRHYPGEGTSACDQYFPGADSSGESGAPAIVAVEEDPSQLGLLLAQIDGRWGLGLRLPEIPRDELGELSLGALRSALVDIYAGSDHLLRVSALELRPGVGAARVDVMPCLQTFRTEPAGTWPGSIDEQRWLLKSKGLEATGTLFRLRRGEWVRLLAGSGVHQEEALLVLADTRCSPPSSIVSETHAQFSSRGLHWAIWEVRLPDEPGDSVTTWLARLGHEFVPRPWTVELATPPRARGEHGEPIFWVGDSPVLTLGAPQSGAETLVSFKFATNSQSANVKVSERRYAHVAIKSQEAGPTRLTAFAERSASLDVFFVQRPSCVALLNELEKTPRLRVWIGEQIIEAWRDSVQKVSVATRLLPEVRVDLGADRARVRVTLWVRGKYRSSRGLDARNAAKTIEAALSTASRIELDAGNLGRVEIIPMLVGASATRESRANDRLSWHQHVVSLVVPPPKEMTTPTMYRQPRGGTLLVARPVGAAVLVRTRLALRRSREGGGSFS